VVKADRISAGLQLIDEISSMNKLNVIGPRPNTLETCDAMRVSSQAA
jgi:hypothetical protein